MTYYNEKTGEYYYEGRSITRRLDDGRIFAGVPTAEQLTEWGFEPYTPPVPERTLEVAKAEKIAQITAYDTSEAVNSFTLGNATMWISRDDRISLMNSTTILKNAGQETTTLWYGGKDETTPWYGKKYTLPCDTLIQMLSALEVYALQCYDVTEEHKAAVNALTTIEDVDAYDYTIGYPEKLSFEV